MWNQRDIFGQSRYKKQDMAARFKPAWGYVNRQDPGIDQEIGMNIHKKPSFRRWRRSILVSFMSWMLIVAPTVQADENASKSRTKLPEIRLCYGEERCMTVEVAATPASRARGLMFREHLADDRGMLFVFPRLYFWGFWMKNTRISLDLIWLDEHRRVVAIVPDVPPCVKEPCKTYQPMQKAMYVLEVNAGTAARWKLKIGDELTFELPDTVKKIIKKQRF